MIRKRLNIFLMLSFVLNLILLFIVTFNVRPVRASAKKVYKSEIVNTASIQTALDQRTAEGWQLVTASAYSPGNAADLTVLIFEKQ